MALTGVAASRSATAWTLEAGGAAAGAAIGAAAVSLLGLTAGALATIAVAPAAFLAARSQFEAPGAFLSPAGAMGGLVLGAVLSTAAEMLRQRRRAGRERTRREQAQRLIVQTLTSLTERRDADTGKHAKRTQEYTRLVASTLAARGVHTDELTPLRIDLMATLAPLHDIGKVGISDAVLHKPGHLTPAEFEEMKRHTELGHETLTRAERAAGVEDDEVLDIIRAGRGTHFDPEIVDAFLACHADIRRLAAEADALVSARP